jgi:hypothetical protein
MIIFAWSHDCEKCIKLRTRERRMHQAYHQEEDDAETTRHMAGLGIRGLPITEEAVEILCHDLV